MKVDEVKEIPGGEGVEATYKNDILSRSLRKMKNIALFRKRTDSSRDMERRVKLGYIVLADQMKLIREMQFQI